MQHCAVQINTDAVRAATIRPMYGAMAAGAAMLAMPGHAAGAPPPGSACGQCGRNASCNKPCGHPGFCSGPRASATAKPGAGRARHSRSPAAPSSRGPGRGGSGSSGGGGSPDDGDGSDGDDDNDGGGSGGCGGAAPVGMARAAEQHGGGAWRGVIPGTYPKPYPSNLTPPRAATRAALADLARRDAAAAPAAEGSGAAAANAPELDVSQLPANMRLERTLSGHDLDSGQARGVLF